MSTTTGALSISRRGLRVHGRLYNIHMYVLTAITNGSGIEHFIDMH